MTSSAAIAAASLMSCSPHRDEPHPTIPPHNTTAPIPSPTDTTVLSSIPSIVPFVTSALKKQGIDLPLNTPSKEQCHAGQPTNGAKHVLQFCVWQPDEAGATGYRMLSVTVGWSDDAGGAVQDLDVLRKQQISPTPVALGDGATVGATRLPGKVIKVRGKTQIVNLGGADLAIRVHNISIDITWAGATYTIDTNGIPANVAGLDRETATTRSIAIAKAIIPQIR